MCIVVRDFKRVLLIHCFFFDLYRYGIPDPYLQREYDMQLKLRMSSVRYTHTNKFHAEMLGFVQQFLQLQDLLGRMRAASAGKKVYLACCRYVSN